MSRALLRGSAEHTGDHRQFGSCRWKWLITASAGRFLQLGQRAFERMEVLVVAAAVRQVAEVELDAGVVAMAVPLAWTIASAAGWVSWELNRAFEHMGVVQEGMQTVAVTNALADKPDAHELDASEVRGEIRFERLTFTFGRSDGRAALARQFR